MLNFKNWFTKDLAKETLKQATDAVVSIDENNHIIFFNPAAEKLWGYSRKEVIGKNVKMLVPSEIQAHHDHYINANRNSDINTVVNTSRDLEIQRKDGTMIWGNLSLSKVKLGKKITYTAFVRDITEQKENQEILHQTLEQTLDAVVMIDDQNQVIFFNPAAERLWGYSNKEVIGKNVKMLFTTEIQTHYEDYINAHPNSGVNTSIDFSRDVEFPRKDGTMTWGNLSLSKTKVGQKINYTAFVKEITEKKENQEIIYQTLEQTIDAVVMIDDQNQVIFFNPAAERLWEYSREEVIGKNVKMLFATEIQVHHDDNLHTAPNAGVNKIVDTAKEVEIQRKDGTMIWGNLSLSKVKLGKKIIYTAFIKDITKQRENQEIMTQTLEQAIDAVVMIDDKNRITFYNPAAEKLWGYTTKEVTGKDIQLLVPLENQQDDRSPNSNENLAVNNIVGTSIEVKIQRKDGDSLWVHLSLSKINLGHKQMYTAFIKDVTDEVTQRNEFATLSLVANKTDNSVIITDANRKIQYINPGFTKLTGYTLEDVIGKKPGAFLQGPHTNPETILRLREKLNAEEPFYDEILNYSTNGESYWISLAINPVFDELGKLKNFISIQANITETKATSIETDARLQAISRSTAVLEWDIEGVLLKSNAYFYQALGFAQSEFSNDLIGSLSSYLSEELWNKLQNMNSLSTTLSFPRKDKEMANFSVQITPIIGADGKLNKFVMYGEDVSQRNQMIAKTHQTMSVMLNQISSIVSTINNLSVQTKTLSLNATLEAARAGESGKGFRVVAEEVRLLAQNSAESAKQIVKLVNETRTHVDEIANIINTNE